MSLPSGTFTPENPSLFSDDNSNQTQIGEQNVVKETVGLDLGKSSNNKQKKLRSEVWNNFVKYTDGNGKEWAKCNICKKLFDGSSKMGTTRLKNHFNSCSKNKKYEGGGSASGDKPAENSNQTQVISLIGLQNDDMQFLLRLFSVGGQGQGQGQGQGSFNATEDNSNQTQEIPQIGEQNVVKETVGLDLGKSSNKKQKKLRSPVWENFEKYTDENGKDWAKCNICKKPFNGSSKMGTTHLKNHFQSCSKNKSKAGGGKPAEDSVMDQQLNRLDKSNEGGGSASGDKAILNFPLEIGSSNSNSVEHELLEVNCGKKRKVVRTETVTTDAGVGIGPLTPLSWTGFWDARKDIFSVPPLSPLSPHPCLGYSRSSNLNSNSVKPELLQVNCGKKRKVVRTETVTTAAGVGVGPLSPSSWTGFWDSSKDIFSVPPLSPLSPYPCMGYSQLTVI